MSEFRSRKTQLGLVFTVMALAVLGLGARTSVAQESILYSFGGVNGDPLEPAAGLVTDGKGNFYGTSEYGGSRGAGAVFELSPKAGGGWTEKVLWNFCPNGGVCLDGVNPLGSLIFDAKGNLYGTTSFGGVNNGSGTVFELSPGTGGVWTEKTLFTFAQYGTTGALPQSNLIFDSKGNLYGTTYQTAANGGCGVVFELTPSTGGTWTEKVLHTFTNQPDGCGPIGGLIFDAKGNLYGTTTNAGDNPTGYAEGTVFELSPATNGTWTEKLLYTFTGANGSADGNDPKGALIFDAKGNLYGTTQQAGGGHNAGVVFELSPTSSGPWTEKILYSFQGQPTDGSYEIGNLVFDAQGNLYGISSQGGAYASGYNGCSIGCGTVFKLSPTSSGGWTESILHDFGANTSDGHGINGGLIADAKGNLYGTSTYGGAYDGVPSTDRGTVWKVSAAGPLTFSPGASTFSGAHTVKITSAVADTLIYYTTDGSIPTEKSNLYTGPIDVTKTETIQAFATAPGYPDTGFYSAHYVVLTPTAQPTLSPAPGTYTKGQTVTIADATKGAVIYYTTNGTTPTTSSTKYTGPIAVNATTTVKAVAIATGDGISTTESGTYTIAPPTATPSISPASGTFTGTETVTITDATAGATIYYTTNGATPTTSSTKYSGAFKLTSTTTVKAIALAAKDSLSAVATATYTLK